MRILKLSENEFIVIKGETAKFFSSKEKLKESGKAPKLEIDIALATLTATGDNYAEFGDINHSFMYTGKI